MKNAKILGLIFTLTFLMIGFSSASAQTSKNKTWKITVSQSGGFAGIQKSYTLDNAGNLNRYNKDQQNYEKIDDAKIAEIGKIVKALKLPGTKLKTVKGLRIYDGIYTGFVINLNDKDYRVDGTSFDDAKYLALSKKQKATLEILKQKLDELKTVLPDSMNNRMN